MTPQQLANKRGTSPRRVVQGLQGGGMGGVPGMSGMSYVPSIFVHLVNDDYAGKLVVSIRSRYAP